jgi:hypothetical protein
VRACVHGIGVGFRFGAGWPPLIPQVERPHDRCIRRRESVRRSRCARLRREAGILSELGLAVPQLRAHVDRDVEARLRPCADCLPATARQAEPSRAEPRFAGPSRHAAQSRAEQSRGEMGGMRHQNPSTKLSQALPKYPTPHLHLQLAVSSEDDSPAHRSAQRSHWSPT